MKQTFDRWEGYCVIFLVSLSVTLLISGLYSLDSDEYQFFTLFDAGLGTILLTILLLLSVEACRWVSAIRRRRAGSVRAAH